MAKSKKPQKLSAKDFPTLNLITEVQIAQDFAKKVYQKFDKIIKSVVLFGSTVKEQRTSGSDIDIIVIVDDASVKFDQELTGWYREELGKIVLANPYQKELHINTVKLTTWWQDLIKGDPTVINIIRYGEEIMDFGGFFRPLRILLQEGRLKSTPEAIYTCLERAPLHLVASKRAEMSAVEGIYWSMVDASHAALMAAGVSPPSPEQIPVLLKENFVDKKLLDMKYVFWVSDIHTLHKGIAHDEIKDIKGENIDDLQKKAQTYMSVMAELIRKLI